MMMVSLPFLCALLGFPLCIYSRFSSYPRKNLDKRVDLHTSTCAFIQKSCEGAHHHSRVWSWERWRRVLWSTHAKGWKRGYNEEIPRRTTCIWALQSPWKGTLAKLCIYRRYQSNPSAGALRQKWRVMGSMYKKIQQMKIHYLLKVWFPFGWTVMWCQNISFCRSLFLFRAAFFQYPTYSLKWKISCFSAFSLIHCCSFWIQEKGSLMSNLLLPEFGPGDAGTRLSAR